jgi:hypothetical protein
VRCQRGAGNAELLAQVADAEPVRTGLDEGAKGGKAMFLGKSPQTVKCALGVHDFDNSGSVEMMPWIVGTRLRACVAGRTRTVSEVLVDALRVSTLRLE